MYHQSVSITFSIGVRVIIDLVTIAGNASGKFRLGHRGEKITGGGETKVKNPRLERETDPKPVR